jgi:hypothetical protein
MLRPQHDRGGRAELGIRDRDNDAARGACYEGDDAVVRPNALDGRRSGG